MNLLDKILITVCLLAYMGVVGSILVAFAQGGLRTPIPPPPEYGLTSAINVADAAASRHVAAINVAFDPKAEWSTLKFGVYPNKVGLQVFDKEAAEEIVRTFNSLGSQLADGFRGLPGYVGHPDDAEWARQNPGVRAEAIARIQEMRVTPEGLQFRTAYNDEGKRLLTGDAPAYTAYSPNWGMKPTTYQGRKAFRPVELYSIGYTNQPNIPGTFIGLNEALPPEQSNPAMKSKIIALLAALGRPVADAAGITDAALETAVNEAIPVATQVVGDAGKLTTASNEKSALQTQLTTAQAAVQTASNEASQLRTSLATERSERAGLAITIAINEGRITEAQRPEWLGKFTAQGADFKAVQAELSKLQKAVNTQSKTADLGARRGQPSSPEQKQRINAINEAIEAKMKAMNTSDRNAAYLALQGEKPELFLTPAKA